MRAGQLRHRITFERLAKAAAGETGQNEFGEPIQNEYGEPLETWVTHAQVSASKEDLTGREAFAAQQLRADVSTRFGVRYIAGLDASMRIRHGATLYDIVSVQDPDGRRRELVIIAAREG